MATKVIVAGSVNGKFQEFFEKLTAVNARNGPFACCFCVGDFFAPDARSSAASLCSQDSLHDSCLAPLRSGVVKGLECSLFAAEPRESC